MMEMKQLDHDLFIDEITMQLGTMFTSPEEYIVTQGDKSNAMFFMVFGDCLIKARDTNFKEKEYQNILTKSDYFGEISLLYNTTRTCSIMGLGYNILARMSKQRLRALLSDYPSFLDKLKKHIYEYKDNYKTFMANVFSKIEILNNLSASTFHKVIYRFQEVQVESDETIMKIDDVCNHLIIVKNGELEVFVEIDQEIFVLEYLKPGSILNCRNF
jgi:CRP-like cAMP-binding protein